VHSVTVAQLKSIQLFIRLTLIEQPRMKALVYLLQASQNIAQMNQNNDRVSYKVRKLQGLAHWATGNRSRGGT